MTYLLSAYEIDLAYGGPEEGGWWFDTGQLLKTVRVYPTEDRAIAACRRANALIHRLQRCRRDVSSVIYAGGRISFDVHQDRAPDFYPEERPFYS